MAWYILPPFVQQIYVKVIQRFFFFILALLYRIILHRDLSLLLA